MYLLRCIDVCKRVGNKRLDGRYELVRVGFRLGMQLLALCEQVDLRRRTTGMHFWFGEADGG